MTMMQFEGARLEEIDGLGVFLVTKDKKYRIDDPSSLSTEWRNYLMDNNIDKKKPGEKDDKFYTLTVAEALKNGGEQALELLSAPSLADQSLESGQDLERIVLDFNYETQVGDRPSHRMHTYGSFNNQDGWLYATTRTWTTTALGGFHGGVSFLLADKDRKVIFSTNPYEHRWGVDGHWIGRSSRTEGWRHQVPVHIAQQARFISIQHSWTPDGIWTILKKAWDLFWTFVQFYNEAQKIKNQVTVTGLKGISFGF